MNTAVIFTNTGYCAVFSKTQRGLCLMYGIILDIHVKIIVERARRTKMRVNGDDVMVSSKFEF